MGDVPSQSRIVDLPDKIQKVYNRVKLLCERAVVNKVMNKMAEYILLERTLTEKERHACIQYILYVCMYVCVYVCMYARMYV
jgi:hypothetical protein